MLRIGCAYSGPVINNSYLCITINAADTHLNRESSTIFDGIHQ